MYQHRYIWMEGSLASTVRLVLIQLKTWMKVSIYSILSLSCTCTCRYVVVCTHVHVPDLLHPHSSCSVHDWCWFLQYIGRVGVVNTVQDGGDIIVRYSNNKVFLINQFALTKVSCTLLASGCMVQSMCVLCVCYTVQTRLSGPLCPLADRCHTG